MLHKDVPLQDTAPKACHMAWLVMVSNEKVSLRRGANNLTDDKKSLLGLQLFVHGHKRKNVYGYHIYAISRLRESWFDQKFLSLQNIVLW